MIQFKYTPEKWDTPLGPMSDPSFIQEMTMTLSGECITWEEATRELHNFLRAAGYVIPYDIEWYEDGKDEDDDLCTALQKLTDWEQTYRPEELEAVKTFDEPEEGNWMSDEFDHRDSLQKLTDKRDADLKIGAWLSAALEDPSTCQSMKDDINEWFECTPQLHRNTMQTEGKTN